MDSINTETEKLNKEEPVLSLPNLVTNNFSYIREEVSRYTSTVAASQAYVQVC